jgi:hypothetical protein
MTLVISKGITLRKGYIGTDDPDAEAYIAAVEAADEAESPGVGALETATKVAIHSFVKGCKADGIWPAIKASCILAGARTLTGALVPLVGAAPTNVGGLFLSGDYNRKTGLGDASNTTKYLNSNRNNNADPQNNNHNAFYATSFPSGTQAYMGADAPTFSVGTNNIGRTSNFFLRNRSSASVSRNVPAAPALIGATRASPGSFITCVSGVSQTHLQASETTFNGNVTIFATGGAIPSASKLAFYSIGESLDLALLDARVTDLINAFAAAIP